MKHRETHPNLDVDGCFACKVAGVSFGAAAMPSRKSHAARTGATEKRWDKDMAAYKRMRADGVQPRAIDGAARVEARAEEKYQVETGLV